MAEVVHHNLEKYVDILTSLKKMDVLSKDQVKSIVSKIREMEYSLLNPKNKNAFYNYVHYMNHLIDWIGLKQSTNQLKMKEIHVRLVSQTARRFKKVVFKHQGDKKLWLSYIKFLKGLHLDKQVGQIYMRMLQVHPHEVGIWIKAGHHFWKAERSFDKARNTFQLSIRHVPSSLALWKEYFLMELHYCRVINSRKDILLRELDSDKYKESYDGKSSVDHSIRKNFDLIILFLITYFSRISI